jgi:hypothetical protein
MITGGVAQVVQHLPSKHKTLRSNTITGRKKKERDGDRKEKEQERKNAKPLLV